MKKAELQLLKDTAATLEEKEQKKKKKPFGAQDSELVITNVIIKTLTACRCSCGGRYRLSPV